MRDLIDFCIFIVSKIAVLLFGSDLGGYSYGDFWSLSLLFLCLLRLLFLPWCGEVVHLPWFVHPGHLNVVVAQVVFPALLPSPGLCRYSYTFNASRVDADTDWDMDMDDIWVASPSGCSLHGCGFID